MLEQRSGKRRRWSSSGTVAMQQAQSPLRWRGSAWRERNLTSESLIFSLINARQRCLLLARAARQSMCIFSCLRLSIESADPIRQNQGSAMLSLRFLADHHSNASLARHILLRKQMSTDQRFNSNPHRDPLPEPHPKAAACSQQPLLQDAVLHLDVHAGSALRVSAASELADLLLPFSLRTMMSGQQRE